MAKYTYSAPGMTVAEIEAAVASLMMWDVTDAATLTKIDQAITSAGLAAATWNGRVWPWLRSRNTFSTVIGTYSYDLRAVNTAVMLDLHGVTGLWCSDASGTSRRLKLEPVETWREWYSAWPTTYNEPESYVFTGASTVYLFPTPSAVRTISVEYVKRHAKIIGGASGAEDSCLIVPGDYHQSVYVAGAIWLLRHETLDPAALAQSPQFSETLTRMAASEVRDLTDASNRFDDVSGAFTNTMTVDGTVRS